MVPVTTRPDTLVLTPALYLAIETGVRKWKVGFSSGLGQRPRIREMLTADLAALEAEIRFAKHRFSLAPDAPVHGCYEAGRDGFWIHRALEQMGVRNRVLDSSSLPVERRARRAKSDKLDAAGLLILLIRLCRGEDRVCRVCRVPSAEAEDRRQLNRGLEAVKDNRTRSINRIKSFLATQGIYLGERGLPRDLGNLRCWDGASLPPGLRSQVEYELRRLQTYDEQYRNLLAERRAVLRDKDDRAAVIARKLIRLRGIGPESGWLFAAELFAWRKFNNVKQLGAVVGLAPTPYQSGTLMRELGISKAGNRRVRSMLIEIAWLWVRNQPHSALTLWFQRRFNTGGSELRRKGIVALARKLLIALWKYVELDVLPEGALLKA